MASANTPKGAKSVTGQTGNKKFSGSAGSTGKAGFQGTNTRQGTKKPVNKHTKNMC